MIESSSEEECLSVNYTRNMYNVLMMLHDLLNENHRRTKKFLKSKKPSCLLNLVLVLRN